MPPIGVIGPHRSAIPDRMFRGYFGLRSSTRRRRTGHSAATPCLTAHFPGVERREKLTEIL
jgi:hypothetical protein